MALFQLASFLTLTLSVVVSGSSVESNELRKKVSPFEKVFAIIQKITRDVNREGEREKAAYADFSCWCESNSVSLEKKAKKYSLKIGDLAADIAEDNADMGKLGRLIFTGNTVGMDKYGGQQNEMVKQLKAEKAKFQNEKNKYLQNKKLIDSAIASMKDSADRVNTGSFIQSDENMASIAEYVAEADAMGLITSPKHKATATALLQGNPMESYGYHGGSSDVIDLVTDLKKQMMSVWSDQADDFDSAISSLKDLILNIQKKMGILGDVIWDQELDLKGTGKEMGQSKTALLQKREELEDTDKVLKQVTSVCQSRAREYDERNQARDNELEALNAATACLNKAEVGAKNQARFLQGAPVVKNVVAPSPKLDNATDAAVAKSAGNETAPTKQLSFLQGLLTKSHVSSHSFLKKAGDTMEETKKQALELLSDEGNKLNSLVLKSVAVLSADPFTKVKDLIERLIVRLNEEAKQETTKKGYCDTEVAKAETSRDFSHKEARTTNTDIRGLEARSDALREAIKSSSESIKDIAKSMKEVNDEAEDLMDKERAALKEQQDALAQIEQALQILSEFYKGAARAAGTDLLQQSEAETPEEEDKEARRQARRRVDQEEGKAKGDVPAAARQGGMKVVNGLLQTLVSDFDRAIRVLEASMEQTRQETVETTTALAEQKKHAEEKRDMDVADLDNTRLSISTRTEDLQTSMDLLDEALKQLEVLKPTCMDSGMSYKDRVAKREQEIAALQKALGWLQKASGKEGNMEIAAGQR